MRINLFLVIVCLILSNNSIAQQVPERSVRKTSVEPVSFYGIRGNVYDAATGEKLPARIVLTDDSGKEIFSYYTKLPGFFTEEDGSFQQTLIPGNYTMKVYHGIDYLSQEFPLTIKNDTGANVSVYLVQWFALKKKGWYSGDGHDHLYTDLKPDTAMVAHVKKICLAQGIDFVCAAQGWAGYNDTTWKQGYSKFNDNRFTIYYGSEMPKYRTGHTWWLGQESTRNYFWQTMDTTYENQYYLSDKGTEWNFNELPFPQIPDIEVIRRFKNADNALAIMAHPTSWWWQKRGDIEKYVTNVATHLSFGLLAGKLWDALVVMGYDHDHYYYQNLWFNVLNQGYRMPAISELDGGLGREDKFYYGSMRTYYRINGKFSIDKMVDAVRMGRTFVTSGPIIITNIDGRYQMGDVVPVNGNRRMLNIEAFASGDKDDYLTYAMVFRNGKMVKLWDLNEKRSRTFRTSYPIDEKERAWYIVKVYGKNTWKNKEMFDVMKVADKKNDIEREYKEGENDVAITSPYYFRRKEDKDPVTLISEVDISVKGNGSEDLNIQILDGGKLVRKVDLKQGKGKFTMPIGALLKITSGEKTPVYRSLYLDYPPYLKIIEELASGRWMNKYDSTVKFNPGEIPWDEFKYADSKRILSDVKWEIDLTPNERDPLWPAFEQLFIRRK